MSKSLELIHVLTLDNSRRRSKVIPAGGLPPEIAQTVLAGLLFLIFCDFLVSPKNTENLTSRRTSQNLKNMIPGRPKPDFKIIFQKTHLLQHVWCETLVFASQTLPFWHRESIQKLCFSKKASWTPFLKIYDDFMRKLSIWRPLQNPVGVKMGHKINQVAPKTFIFDFYGSDFFPVRETLKHVETPSGLDLRFVYVFHYSTFSSFSGTVITKHMIFLFL